jgi:hypothetical protein
MENLVYRSICRAPGVLVCMYPNNVLANRLHFENVLFPPCIHIKPIDITTSGHDSIPLGIAAAGRSRVRGNDALGTSS